MIKEILRLSIHSKDLEEYLDYFGKLERIENFISEETPNEVLSDEEIIYFKISGESHASSIK